MKRLTRCPYCGGRDTRKWRWCASCGEHYRWQRIPRSKDISGELWKRVVTMETFLLAVLVFCLSVG